MPIRLPCALRLAIPAAALLALPASAQEITLRAPTQSARVYARDGSLIAELGPQVRTVIAMRTLPRYVPMAFVAVEDRRFFEHAGVDARAVARALRNTLGGDREGASTITQQLIGAMYPERVNRQEQTAERKLREMRLALELEQRHGKERILESYLNWIYFGHGWYGIESAARHYFGKGAAQLSIEEAAMLAALPKGPGVYSPKISPARALERRNLVLDLMAQSNAITRAQAAAAKRTTIRLAPNHGYSARPQWAIEQAKQILAQRVGPQYGTTGARVWTTIDPAAQNAADSALVRGLARIEREAWYRGPRMGAPGTASPTGTTYLQGAIVTVDARTGEILAMVGGRNFEESHFNRVTAARRQPGSSFKPLVYAAALEQGATPATMMEDTALRIVMRGSAVYSPRNSDGRFRGPISVRDGLVESVNTVAVQLAQTMGWQTLPAIAARFGIKSQVQPYPSSAIGASAVAPLEMAAAYTAFANNGMRVEPFLVRRVMDGGGRVVYDGRGRGVRTLSPALAFVTTDLLRDAAERGTGREARTRLPARVPMAGKTGTTNDGTDVWYVGYTPEMVTAVWLGFDRPRSIGPGAFGGTLAAPIWGEMMRAAYARRRSPAPWAMPAGVVAVAADAATRRPLSGACPAAAARREYFIAGTEPAGACRVLGGRVVAPARPAPDSLVPDSLAPAPDTAAP
ncbi:MAG TPA: PBP1A family penicillin-binding protein [Longimicrobium sp.]|jgi:penicillin-binding protein 1A